MMAMQVVTVQRLDLRPIDGSVCCAVGPLIRPLHASLMTDRGENASPVSSAHLSARRFHHRGRWQLHQPELEESVGRHTRSAGLLTLLVPDRFSLAPDTSSV